MPQRWRIHRSDSPSSDTSTFPRTNTRVERRYSAVTRRRRTLSRPSGHIVTPQWLLPVLLLLLVYHCSSLSSHSVAFTSAFLIPVSVSLAWSVSTTSFRCTGRNRPTILPVLWMTSSDDRAQQTDAETANPPTLHTGGAGQPRDDDDGTSWLHTTLATERSGAWPLHWFASAFGIDSNTGGSRQQSHQPQHQYTKQTTRLGWLRHRGGGSDRDGTTSLRSSSTRTSEASESMASTSTDHATSTTRESSHVHTCNGEENKAASFPSINCTSPTSSAVIVTTHASVHLQLTDPTLAETAKSKRESGLTGDSNDIPSSTNTTMATDDDDDDDDATTTATEPSDPPPKTITVHTFHNSTNNMTWKALNTAKRKFHAYLQYSGAISEGMHAHIETVRHVFEVVPTSETTTGVNTMEGTVLYQDGDAATPATIDLEDMRREWRQLWKSGRLLTDRTELVAIYPSDIDKKLQPRTNINNDNTTMASSAPTMITTRKRGGFADLLQLYTDRVLAMLQDEKEDVLLTLMNTPFLLQWLESSYGRPETAALMFENFRTLPENDQLVKYKHFLEWFRSQFPYYYDRCDSCGASIKEDKAAATAVGTVSTDDATTIIDEEVSSNSPESIDGLPNKDDDDDDDLDDDSNHRTFVGYTYPDAIELQGKASRTELYQCHVCKSFTRFPRFNSAAHVIAKRRGRCGEYSMLLFRLLRALNHECRWVVDWADHVWAEVLLTPASSLPLASPRESHRRWVHLDPCEAAVDETFLYQDWGKKQTFILGFYLPLKSSSHLTDAVTSCGNQTTRSIPLIEDITQHYTREPWSAVCERREESEEQVQSSIYKAISDLENKLVQFSQTTSSFQAESKE